MNVLRFYDIKRADKANKTNYYGELQEKLLAFAEKKEGDAFKQRKAKVESLYANGLGKANDELTNDLIGEYIYGEKNSDFIKNLSVENKNLFKWLWDEVKYLYNMATAGSQEQRELLRIKKLFEKAYRESAKAKTEAKTEAKGTVDFSLESKTQPGKLDPRTVTKTDVVDMLNQVGEGAIYGNTYIPVRINTPSTLIYWASERRGDIIDNNPIAISAEKAFNAMNRSGETESGRPNMLSADDMVSMIESMNDPQYIVYQGANDRYVEVVQFNTTTGDTAFAVIEIGNDKDSVYMNGYEGGLYNILVTTYPPKAGKLKELLKNPNNQVIYDKNKDAPQRTSGSTVPSVLNDASFFEDSLPNSEDSVKREFSLSDSNGNQLSEGQQNYFKDSVVRDENGNLKPMYHGTSQGGYTVFDTYGSNYGLFGILRKTRNQHLKEEQMMDTCFDVNKVFQDRLAVSFGLDKYHYIVSRVNETDVSLDADFQRTFNGFYIVRRNESWRKTYYEHLEKMKSETPTFASILTYLFEKTGNIEPSFSSKMLATIYPDKPIWDRYVVQNLNLELTGLTKQERLKNAIFLYLKIEKWYEEFLQTDKAEECIKTFDRLLPDYRWLSSIKKIDCILWSIR